MIKSLIGPADISYNTSHEFAAKRQAELLADLFRGRFQTISFGADVAERDLNLMNYFISTKTFDRVAKGDASVVIGPKGSGKSAILKALAAYRGEKNSITITPEVFATSMLRQVINDNQGLWDEEQAFVSTWIFTILIEVFKRVAQDPRGVPPNTLKKLRAFLRDNVQYQELDMFTRFIGYLKKIEGVKIGTYEITIKTRMLQELYSLAPLYELVPSLRGAGGGIIILLDELDQGWDNSPHSNRFIASLLKAAIKIQNLGLKAHVVAFLRSEIFDLIKDQLDHLDKLRSSIEFIVWTDGELADLIIKRVAHSIKVPYQRTGYELEMLTKLFDFNIDGMPGFTYLLSRTSLRPREVLQFIRHAHRLGCDAQARGFTEDIVRKAEEDYSAWKLEHLGSEYAHIYPHLSDLIWSFRGNGPVLSDTDVFSIIKDYREGMSDSTEVPWLKSDDIDVAQVLYRVEFLGVPRPVTNKRRPGLFGMYEFAYERRAGSVRMKNSFCIHPAFWAVLEVPRIEH
jgi:energy-coupling factor transporter ATP-binding protein EcfA2